MFKRFNQFNSKKYYTNPNNQFKSPKDNDFYSGILSGILAGIFGSTLYIEKKSQYTDNEKVSRNMVIGLTSLSASYSVFHLIKYLRK
jgi:hypothetical protein